MAAGWLNALCLLVVVHSDALRLQLLDALRVDVVDLDDVVGVEVVVVVLFGDDSLCVQVSSVHSSDDDLVVLMVDVVLNDVGLASGKVLLGRLVDNNVIVLDPSRVWSWNGRLDQA